MRANPDIKGFFAANDQMALGRPGRQERRQAGRHPDHRRRRHRGRAECGRGRRPGGHRLAVPVHDRRARRRGLPRASQGEELPANVKAPVQVVTKDNVAKAQENFPEPVEAYDDPFASLIGK